MTESSEKIAKVRAYLTQHKLDGIVLNTRPNFAWLSGGGDNHVVSQSERGFGALVVTARSAWLLANRIEVDRLHTEEHLTAFTPKTFAWTESIGDAAIKLIGDKAKAKRFATDDPEAIPLQKLPGDFNDEVRARLCEAEIRRFKGLGRDCAVVIETVARQLNPGDSEHQAEADLAKHLLARGIQPHVLLIAFDERIRRYRHPTPVQNHLRKCAMLVVCGQRHGLIASLTRLVHFGALPADLAQRHEKVCEVEAALWQATVPGTAWGKVLQAGIDAYKKAGFAKEWELHHQGGPTGYSGRDFCVIPDEKRKVQDFQAVAWNPSITGTKTEDTFILENGQRSVVTACSPEWPSLKIGSGKDQIVRPGILVR